MPAKKKNVKSKLAPKVKAKAPAKRAVSAKKKQEKPKLKLVPKLKEKQPEMKKKQKNSPPQAPNFFRQLLEARKKEREERQQKEQIHRESQSRQFVSDKHARFGRYAGPRRRAA